MYHDNIDYENDPHLSILNVADKCCISYKPEGKRFTSVCPFCGAKPGHFYLTPEDGKYKNVYKCVKCGTSGSSVDLYARLHSCDHKQAFKELMGFDVKSSTINYIKKEAKEKADVKQNPIASVNIRNVVYRELLKNLSLSEKHYLNLKNRGLSGTDIKRNGYKTLPFDKAFKRKTCDELISQGLTLKGIPGFYTDRYNYWTFWTPQGGGFLVPVIDYLGRVQGCQIRKDETSKSKYPWFSSSYMENGTQMDGCIHVHWNTVHSISKIVITEGPLKATIASILSNTTFVAVPGVSALHDLPRVLCYMIATKTKKISSMKKNIKLYIAYDMDKRSNPAVAKALCTLNTRLIKSGFNPKPCNWNPEYKGIDDYLLHLFHVKSLKNNEIANKLC